ncbi:hypothetical protein [Luedemannella helvata]|uniref:Secreted protein n=1 Tax=Luedemannella helvata TaxID=349315 RepID=A0ABN2L8C8_9ACTN
MLTCALVTTVIVVGGILVLRRHRKRPSPGSRNTYQLGKVVLDAYGEDWSTRLGQPLTVLRRAALGGGDQELRQALDKLVGPVEVDFDGAAKSGGSVPVTVTVAYSDDRTQSRAEMMLPWDLVPELVRADLIRGRTTVSQTWRAAPATDQAG